MFREDVTFNILKITAKHSLPKVISNASAHHVSDISGKPKVHHIISQW